jgi:hypothetical protein
VELVRVFDWDGHSLGRSDGGPLYVARARQGSGRHDAPALYCAWYCSLAAISAIAETIQYLRGHRVTDADFRRVGGTTKAIVRLRVADSLPVVDLDDPSELVARGRRPSQVATLRRAVTQRIAADIFAEGVIGLRWWSTLEAEWTNVTLFHERAVRHVSIVEAPRRLSTRLIEVQQAADHLGIHV